jgi:hypothetical protein
MDAETPTMGTHIPEACTEERGGRSTRDNLAGLDPGGPCPPTMMLALEGPRRHPVEVSSLRTTLVGTCGNSRGVLNPNISLGGLMFQQGD